MAKISVIIPVYGVEKYINKAIDSVLSQTLEDIEIILIDDGSKDNCPHIIDEYAKKDSRVVVIHKPNKGYGHSCNIGIDNAHGEYIAIFEPDDYISSTMYENLYNIAKEYNSDIVKSAFYDCIQYSETENAKITKSGWSSDISEDRSFTIKEFPQFLTYHPSIWSCIYKTDFIRNNNIRFIEYPGSGWTDNPFQVATLCLAQRINYTSNAYYYWYQRSNNLEDNSIDYKIPLMRSEEIHDWLSENKIDDKGILASIYKREFIYIRMILLQKNKFDKKDCFKKIEHLVNKMDSNIVLSSKILNSDEKLMFKEITNGKIWFSYFKVNLKKLRKQILSIKINKKNYTITIFGKTWNNYNGKYAN